MKKKCIIIDDNATNRLVAHEMVEEIGLEVIDEAESGYTGLDLVFDRKVDVILLDWHMPMMDGLAFIDNIRVTEEGKKMQIILYSAVEGESSIQQALTKGADGFIAKPITFKKMEEEFKRLNII